MQVFKSFRPIAVALIGLFIVSAGFKAASASVIHYGGACNSYGQGCAALTPVTATLTLSNSYVFGSGLVATDVLAFDYSSSVGSASYNPSTDTLHLVSGAFTGTESGSLKSFYIEWTSNVHQFFVTDMPLIDTCGGGIAGGFCYQSNATSLFEFGTGTWTAVTAVPEPATLALFGFGLAGLGFARRRKAA